MDRPGSSVDALISSTAQLGADDVFLVLPVLKVLYIFAGKQRKSDLGDCLRRLCSSQHYSCLIIEKDLERSPLDDVTDSNIWDSILKDIKHGNFDTLLMTESLSHYFMKAQHADHRLPCEMFVECHGLKQVYESCLNQVSSLS